MSNGQAEERQGGEVRGAMKQRAEFVGRSNEGWSVRVNNLKQEWMDMGTVTTLREQEEEDNKEEGEVAM